MIRSLDPRDPQPLHRQAEAALRGLIRSARYRAGQLLPDEVRLSREMGISRNTLRAALDRLVRDGLLERRRGVGTRVREPGATTNLTEWTSFSREMEIQGIAVRTFSISARRVPASAEAAQALGLAALTPVLRLDRLRGYDGAPVVHFRSWLHPRLGLTGREDFARPLYEVIREVSGVSPARSEERIRAIPAPRGIAASLRVAPGAPLLVRQRRVCDRGGRPLEYAVNHYRGDRFTYRMDIQRSAP